MAIKKENTIVPVTLAPFHMTKLTAICNRTWLTKSGVVQRMIEQYNLFEIQDEKPPASDKE